MMFINDIFGEVQDMLWNAKNGAVPIDNTSMEYVSFGHGDKAFILLPGLSDGLATVKGKAVLLAKPYELFFRDYTVYMFSRKNDIPEGYSIRDMAADQARAMRALGIRKASVMGVSQGGMIAQYLAIDYAELIDKLVVAVSAPYANETVVSCVSTWIGFAEQGDHRSLMIDTAEKSYSPEYIKKFRRIYPIIGKVGKPASYNRFLVNAHAILAFDALQDLRNITCPTLIIGGEDDKIVGVHASCELKEHIPGSELFIYPGLGHAAYEEAGDFNRRVYEFLMKKERSRVGGEESEP